MEPSLAHREQYKTAKYVLTETEFIPPHEEMIRTLLGSLYEQIVNGIAQDRSLSTDTVRALIDRGPFSVAQAVEAKLINAAKYRDEVYEELRKEAGGKAKAYPLDSYLKQTGGHYGKGKRLALIHGVGTIHAGKSGYDPFGGVLMGAQTLTRAVRLAAADPKIKAIVFRINSPGGSYVASDAIWRAVVQAKERGKPVIVSMSDVAASGGYFVAAPADIIVAHPGTLTGSIGVVGGKVITEGFWNKLGVSWDEIHTNENATIGLPTQDFTPDQWDRLQNRLDSIYMDFKRKVAQGRNIDMEQVEKAAKGRVWTGAEAHRLGLVDTLGGLPEAVRLAKDAAGIAADEPVRLEVFPKPKPLLKRLLAGMSSETSEESMFLSPHTRRRLQQLRRIVGQAGIDYPRGELHMHGIEAGGE
jgi:protease-4